MPWTRFGRKRDIPGGLWTKCESCGELIFRKDLEMANSVIDEGRNVVRACESHGKDLRVKDSREAIITHMVLDSIIRSTMYAVDIAEIAINGTMRD